MKTPTKPPRTRTTGRQKSAAVVRTRTAEHVKRREERVISFLTQDQLRRLFKVIRSKRDKTIFLVGYRHGLRASEIGLLQRADVDAKQGRISIHRLKDSISGWYPLQPDVLKAIRSYLRIRADESPYLRHFLHRMGRDAHQGEVGVVMEGQYFGIRDYDAPEP